MNGEVQHVGAEWSDSAAACPRRRRGGLGSAYLAPSLPADLEAGEYSAEVTASGLHDREFTTANLSFGRTGDQVLTNHGPSHDPRILGCDFVSP